MINAQEAYQNSVKKMAYIDTSEVMTKIEEQIQRVIDLGGSATSFGPITNMTMAEKIAIELQDLGYYTTTMQYPPVYENGLQIPASGVFINWKNLPASSRESYN